MSSPEAFFAFARARHQIFLDRNSGKPRPWTDDPILQQYRFTNVFREEDRTSLWFRHYVRCWLSKMSEECQVLGTILFRTLNRTESGEILFQQNDLFRGEPVGWRYVKGLATIEEVEANLRTAIPRGPWVTGAYIVKTPDGMDKLTGALWIVEEARKRLPALVGGHPLQTTPRTLEAFWLALQKFPYIGGFTGYEIVTDLRHLPILRDAPDIMSWANAGPGAVRGLHRVHGRDHRKSLSQAQACREMQDLLSIARSDLTAWPEHGRLWPEWEMREVEHTLCEFDKYERVRLGEGTPRGRFR